MDFAKLALSRAVTDKSLSAFIDRGVTPAMMPEPDSAAVLKWLLDFHKQHGDVASPETVATAFPAYPLAYAAEPATYYVDHVLNGYARVQMTDTLLASAKRLGSGSPFDVVADVQSAAQRLSLLTQSRTERSIEENTTQRWQRFLDRKTKVGITGIPTPWGSLDDMTQGWQPEDYVVWVARPKVGKTWAMLRLAHAAWLHGRRVLFVNKEMPDTLMERRWDALHHKLDYERFRTGMLTDAEEARYKAGLDTLAKGIFPPFTFVHGAMTVSSVAAKVEELKPDIVFVDGAYLLVDEERARVWWEKNMNISRGLKRLVQRYRVPLHATTQLARTGDTKKNKDTELTASDVGGSDAFVQDADVLLALQQTEDQRFQRVLDIVPLAVREAPPDTIQVGWDFQTMESADFGKKSRSFPAPAVPGAEQADAMRAPEATLDFDN